jgi:hypothetical protein
LHEIVVSMRGVGPILASALAAAVGCSSGPGGGTDPELDGGGGEIDAPDGGEGGGLRLVLESDPDIPGSFEADYFPTMDEVELSLADFRAIGDAAPGDDRTLISTLRLTWSEGGDEVVRFPDAPIGRYSRIRASVESFRLAGTCVIEGETWSWAIEDAATGGIDIDVTLENVEVMPGSETRVELDVDLERIYTHVEDWADIEEVAGVLLIDGSHPQIEELRTRFNEVFEHETEGG